MSPPRPLGRPEVLCPICGEACSGGLDLHRHQQAFHSQEEIERHRRETEEVEFEANHASVRAGEDLDRWLEYGGG